MWIEAATVKEYGYYIDKDGREVNWRSGKWWHDDDLIETPGLVMDLIQHNTVRNNSGNAYESVFNMCCANGSDYEVCQAAGRKAAIFAINDYVNREETLDRLMRGYEHVG